MKKLLLILLSCFVCEPLLASKVLDVKIESNLVAIADDPENVWQPGTYVCLLKNYQRAYCGDVIKSGARGFIMLITSRYKDLVKGDLVDIIQPETITRIRMLTLGSDLTFPFAHVQQLFHEHFSYGVMTSAIVFPRRSGSDYLLGFALIGTLNFYTGHYRGFWARAGLGMMIANSYSVTDPSQTNQTASKVGIVSAVGMGTVGFRIVLGSKFTLGAAVGGYLFPDGHVKYLTNSLGAKPVGSLDLGFIF